MLAGTRKGLPEWSSVSVSARSPPFMGSSRRHHGKHADGGLQESLYGVFNQLMALRCQTLGGKCRYCDFFLRSLVPHLAMILWASPSIGPWLRRGRRADVDMRPRRLYGDSQTRDALFATAQEEKGTPSARSRHATARRGPGNLPAERISWTLSSPHRRFV